MLRHSTALSGHLNLTVIWCITDQTIKKMDLVSTDPDTRVGVQWAHTCNMRSNCQCSCVLQFTLCHAFSSVLHRPPSQLIHCIVLYSKFFCSHKEKVSTHPEASFPGEKGSKVGTRPGHRAAAHRHSPGLASRGTDHCLAAPQQTGCRPASSQAPSRARDPGWFKVSRQQSLGL